MPVSGWGDWSWVDLKLTLVGGCSEHPGFVET